MKLLKPLFLIFFYFSLSFSFAQTGTIQGKITDGNINAMEFANVYLKETMQGSTSNQEGIYEITNVIPGDYTIVISAVGYETTSATVTIRPGVQTLYDVRLTLSTKALQELEIIGRRENSYKSDYSFAATKTQTPFKDIPQTISTVTKELIQDQQSYRLNDVVKNVAGINQFSVYDDITIRGFRNSSSNGRLLNGLRTFNNFWQSPLLVNIERIEVIKGPASAIFSNTSPGGTINMITKNL